MEVDEEPSNSADPVEDASLPPDPETEPTKAPAAREDASSNPDGTSCPLLTPPEDGPGPDKENQKDSPRREQVGEAGTEEEPIPVDETLEPREMDATPAVTPPSPDTLTGAGERVTVAEYHAPTPEGYVTPTGVLSATGSPTWPRASPKQKQLSSPEGSEIAAGLVSAVKRHCGSESESIPGSRLPGRMPYGLPAHIDGEEPKVVGGERSQTPTSEGNESPGALPATPEHTAHSPGLSQEEGPDDLVFVTPPEEDRPSETMRGGLAKSEKEANEEFLELMDELTEPPTRPAPVGAPSKTKSPPPVGFGASIEDTSPPVEDEREQPPESEPAAASTWPSSPVAEEEDDPTIPLFQFTQPLNQSTDSCGDNFQSPIGEVTLPYQHHLGITSMRTSDWTYYHAQDEADPTVYHPDWPTGMRRLGPLRVPAGSESRARIPPLFPTYLGRTLWRKIADLKQQKSWGNVQEQPGILQHMWTTDKAIKNDLDWAATYGDPLCQTRPLC